MGPLVWALLKGNFAKYSGILKEIYTEEAGKNGPIGDVEEYKRLVRNMKFRLGGGETNLNGLQQQFLVRAIFYPDLGGKDKDPDAYTQIRGAMYPIGAGTRKRMVQDTNLNTYINSALAPSLLLRQTGRPDVIPIQGSTELFKNLFDGHTHKDNDRRDRRCPDRIPERWRHLAGLHVRQRHQ